MTDLLAIGAHPDDVDLCVGGLLAGAVSAGLTVRILDLTAGERGSRGTVATRRREAAAAAEVLGVRERACLGLADAGVRDDEASRRQLATWIRAQRPRRVLAPWFEDVHPDHRAAAELVRSAWFLSGLRAHESLDGPAFRPEELLHFPGLPGRGATFPEPTAVVAIDRFRATKLEAVRCFESQFGSGNADGPEPAGGPEPLERLEARDRFYGARIGQRFGEPLIERGPRELGLESWAP